MEVLRAEHAAFDARAEVRLLGAHNESLLGIERRFDGETLVALFNFAPFAQAGLPGEAGEYVDLWNGDVRRAEDVIVPGGGFRWMVKK